jgi:hypothetical protein
MRKNLVCNALHCIDLLPDTTLSFCKSDAETRRSRDASLWLTHTRSQRAQESHGI